MPPEITVGQDGKVSYKFFCKMYAHWIVMLSLTASHRKPSLHVSRSRDDKSTSNLVSHIKNCEPAPSNQRNAIESYAHGHSYSQAAFRLLLVKWVTSCSRPYSIVQDEPFVRIVKMLYNRATLVSPHTLSTDVRKAFHLSKEALINRLEVHIYMLRVPHMSLNHS